uniref:Transcription factor CBF/NF-Y/archaeal histone domain-containing protein n=1 Tax=Carnegiea gigantea TaxID=171969 RepID=A0A9Q1KXS9_9CARY|nr:hypothetical protein Cgig2_018157 [Carnegiea gigantea]
MADNEEISDVINPSFPTARVKKIVKIDKDINRISSEALFLVSGATELFLQFLAEKSAQIAAEKKRKTVKIDHLRVAVKRHHPTRDFLLDSLPSPSQPPDRPAAAAGTVKEKPAPPNTRSIDSFFRKPQREEGPSCVNEHDNLVSNDALVNEISISTKAASKASYEKLAAFTSTVHKGLHSVIKLGQNVVAYVFRYTIQLV